MIVQNSSVILSNEETQALRDLEDSIGNTIPQVTEVRKIEIDWKGKICYSYNQGYVIEDGCITKLCIISKDEERKIASFPKKIENLSHLKEIYVINHAFTTFPRKITKLKHLRIIDVSGNEFRYIFDWLRRLKGVEELILKNNRLETLPQWFTAFSNLQTLDISQNNFKKLPDLNGLTNLKQLDISENKITSLPESFINLRSLKYLNASYNELVDLPNWLISLKELEVLDFSCNHISTLHSWIGNFPRLQSLNLSQNQIQTIPDSIGKLESLKSLNLFRNKIDSLPESIGALKNLENLLLTENQLKSLPETIGHISCLTDLRLAFNQLKVLPNSLGNLKKLKVLYLYRNSNLESLPESLKHLPLEELNLGWCRQLKSIPEWFKELCSLRILKLGSMKLHSLPSLEALKSLTTLELGNNPKLPLPEWLTKIKSLRQLSLQMNKLKQLPEWFSELDFLEYLNLDSNELQTIPAFLKNFKTLRTLNLKRNKLVELPLWLGELQLESLDLSNNRLQSLPETFGNFVSLKHLNLSKNNFTSLMGVLGKLTNLKEVSLAENPWDVKSTEIIKKPLPLILEYCREKAEIHVFISYTVVDYDYFRIGELAKRLEEREEIYRVYYCDKDLAGNIDSYMREYIAKSQLVLFMANNRSVYHSKDCKYELELARENNIEIIPIKAEDIHWKELEEVNLSREIGKEFSADNFEEFVDDLYSYIIKFKRKIDLFDKEQGRIDKDIVNLKNKLLNFLDSEDFNRFLEMKFKQRSKNLESIVESPKGTTKLFSNLFQEYLTFKKENNNFSE